MSSIPSQPWAKMRQTVLSLLERFKNEKDWKQVKGPSEVEAWTLDKPELPYPVVRCRTQLGTSAEELMAFLVDDITETLPKWSRDIVACEEILRISADERILLVRTKGPVSLISAREDLFYALRGQDPKTGFFEASRMVDLSEPPVTPGAVRSQMHFAYKFIRPLGPNSCEYDVGWQYDSMGYLSRFLPRKLMVKGIHDHLKDECKKLQKRYPQKTPS